jgi:NAD(P)-dependent dehydrogenase (short-subunit alcohol dehydrogenase family)
MTLAINHFGHFYLTFLLWSAIQKSEEARVINVSSEMHYHAPSDNYLGDIQCQYKSFSGYSQYGISKLYNVLFTQGLKNLIARNNLSNVKTATLHPGVVDTGFGQNLALMKCVKCICCCIFIKQEEGTVSTLYLFRSPFEDIINGEYYNEKARVTEMDSRGRNQSDV